jgi:hypothetical protein
MSERPLSGFLLTFFNTVLAMWHSQSPVWLLYIRPFPCYTSIGLQPKPIRTLPG